MVFIILILNIYYLSNRTLPSPLILEYLYVYIYISQINSLYLPPTFTNTIINNISYIMFVNYIRTSTSKLRVKSKLIILNLNQIKYYLNVNDL